MPADAIPTVGSDPAGGFVYIGQKDGPPSRITLAQARDLVSDLLWHMERAARGDEPRHGWPEDAPPMGARDAR